MEGVTIDDIKDIFSLSLNIGVYRNRSVEDDILDMLFGATDFIVDEGMSPQEVIQDLRIKCISVSDDGYWSNGVSFKRIGLYYC